jgi:hypothetical protein
MTCRAEDGSGVGSAIIAGEISFAFFLPTQRMRINTSISLSLSSPAMTKVRKDAGLYAHL